MRQTQSSALHKLQQLNADADEAFTNLSKPRGHANAERRSRLVPYTALLLALVGALTIVVSHESHDQASFKILGDRSAVSPLSAEHLGWSPLSVDTAAGDTDGASATPAQHRSQRRAHRLTTSRLTTPVPALHRVPLADPQHVGIPCARWLRRRSRGWFRRRGGRPPIVRLRIGRRRERFIRWAG